MMRLSPPKRPALAYSISSRLVLMAPFLVLALWVLLFTQEVTASPTELAHLRFSGGWQVWLPTDPGLTTLNGPRLGVEARFHLTRSVFLGGEVSYFQRKRYMGYLDTQEREVAAPIVDLQDISAAVTAGYRFRVGKRWQPSLAAGVGLAMTDADILIDDPTPDLTEYQDLRRNVVPYAVARLGMDFLLSDVIHLFVEVTGRAGGSMDWEFLGRPEYRSITAAWGVAIALPSR